LRKFRRRFQKGNSIGVLVDVEVFGENLGISKGEFVGVLEKITRVVLIGDVKGIIAEGPPAPAASVIFVWQKKRKCKFVCEFTVW